MICKNEDEYRKVTIARSVALSARSSLRPPLRTANPSKGRASWTSAVARRLRPPQTRGNRPAPTSPPARSSNTLPEVGSATRSLPRKPRTVPADRSLTPYETRRSPRLLHPRVREVDTAPPDRGEAWNRKGKKNLWGVCGPTKLINCYVGVEDGGDSGRKTDNEHGGRPCGRAREVSPVSLPAAGIRTMLRLADPGKARPEWIGRGKEKSRTLGDAGSSFVDRPMDRPRSSGGRTGLRHLL